MECNIDYAGISDAYKMAIEALDQSEVEAIKSQQAYNKGFEDCRQAVLDAISRIGLHKSDTKEVQVVAECLRSVEALTLDVTGKDAGKGINNTLTERESEVQL